MTTRARAGGTTAGNRRWTEAEDEVIRNAAVLNRHDDKGGSAGAAVAGGCGRWRRPSAGAMAPPGAGPCASVHPRIRPLDPAHQEGRPVATLQGAAGNGNPTGTAGAWPWPRPE